MVKSEKSLENSLKRKSVSSSSSVESIRQQLGRQLNPLQIRNLFVTFFWIMISKIP
jgi:hypothetical protein